MAVARAKLKESVARMRKLREEAQKAGQRIRKEGEEKTEKGG